MAQVSDVADNQPPQTKTLRIARFNPEKDNEKQFVEFSVPVEKWTTVLETILDVKQHHDHSVAVQRGADFGGGPCWSRLSG